MDAVLNYIDQFSFQISLLLICLLAAVFAVLCWVWLYNRRQYQNLKHQIPAKIVKNYLDSIIQNSTALKSSLFRGGGLDVDVNSIPSVMPLSELPGGTQVSVDTQGSSALRVQLEKLEAELADKRSIIQELESHNNGLKEELGYREERIIELEEIINGLNDSSLEGEDSSQELEGLNREVESLKEQLQEYEILSADIADMKKLKEENTQLKAALDNSDSSSTEAPSPETQDEEDLESSTLDQEIEELSAAAGLDAASDDSDLEASEAPAEEDEVEEDILEAQPTSEQEVDEAADEVVAKAQGEEEEEKEEPSKTPEDLLSEFEKMLG